MEPFNFDALLMKAYYLFCKNKGIIPEGLFVEIVVSADDLFFDFYDYHEFWKFLGVYKRIEHYEDSPELCDLLLETFHFLPN